MPSNATVFVTNMASDHNYKAAVPFGAIRPITSGNYPVFKTARLMEEIAQTLADSSPEDYLLFSGSGFVCGLCLVMWLQIHRECKVLLFDRKTYVPRVITREDIVIQTETARDKVSER